MRDGIVDHSASAGQPRARAAEVQPACRQALTAIARLGTIFALEGHRGLRPAAGCLKLAELWPGDEDENFGKEA
jgi:hypothetical protein